MSFRRILKSALDNDAVVFYGVYCGGVVVTRGTFAMMEKSLGIKSHERDECYTNFCSAVWPVTWAVVTVVCGMAIPVYGAQKALDFLEGKNKKK